MLADVQTLVEDLVRDGAGKVSAAQRDSAIALGVARYSADRPRPGVAAVAALGGPRLPLPEGWTAASRVVQIEWPVGENPPAQVRHLVHRTPDGEEILVEADLTAGEAAHVHYTCEHILSDVQDTIPVEHREAVAAYAAALLFDQLSNDAAANTDSTLQADAVEHKSQAQEYASRARAHRKRYADVLGAIDGPVVRPGSATTSWPATRRFPGAGAARR